MKVYLNPTHVPALKRRLRDALPNLGASVRIEAVARGLGFNTYAGFQARLNTGHLVADFDEPAFIDFLRERDAHAEPRTLQRCVIRALLEPVIESDARLTTHGFGVPRRNYPGEKYAQELTRSRAEFYDDWSCDQFELALEFLQRCDRRKTLNRDFSTYGLKHKAENISREYKIRTELGDYVSNGLLIVAALYEGFSVQQIDWDSLNGVLNISTKSVRKFRDRSSVQSLFEDELENAA